MDLLIRMCAVMFYNGRKVRRTLIKSWHARLEVTLNLNATDLFQKLFVGFCGQCTSDRL